MMTRLIWLIGKLSLPIFLLVSAQASYPRSRVIVDSKYNVQSFYGIPINLTTSSLKRLSYRVKIRQSTKEGDVYTTADITAKDGIKLKATFKLNGKLHVIETHSPDAMDRKGIKIGTPLSQVRASWPMGRLIYGVEEGKAVVTYITGTNVLFDFDPRDMPPQAFDRTGRKDTEVPNLRVRTIRIFSTPISVPDSCVPGYCL